MDFDKESRENEALRKELGFFRTAELQLTACPVLSNNEFGLSDVVYLSCGKEQGVSEGQAAVSQGYLVGKVIFAGQTVSSMLIAKSSKFLTDAKMSRSGQQGVLKGSFNSGMILDQLSQKTEVESGLLVVTAGIDPKIPKDILLGEAGQVISTGNDLFKKITVLNPVDFNNLKFVFVVK